jgi:hypothetical protein
MLLIGMFPIGKPASTYGHTIRVFQQPGRRNAYEALELKQRMAAFALNETKEMMVIPSLACCLSYKANSLRG